MTLSINFESFYVYVLVFCRMGGMIYFNPLLNRRNIPSQIKMALILGLTIILAPIVQAPVDGTYLGLFIIKELLIGLACGYVFQLFYYLLFMTGEIIDMGFGLSMAKAFDPSTNLQASMSGNLLQFLFVMYFFTTNSHLVLIRLFAASYDLVGIGATSFGGNLDQFFLTLFTNAFLLAMQLALPFLAATFVLELAMGMLMKLIPQINVFVIHFPIKIMFGLLLLFIFANPISKFLQNYIEVLFQNLQQVLVT